jgi:Mn2+/Fe2+ NRAMP family transporter
MSKSIIINAFYKNHLSWLIFLVIIFEVGTGLLIYFFAAEIIAYTIMSAIIGSMLAYFILLIRMMFTKNRTISNKNNYPCDCSDNNNSENQSHSNHCDNCDDGVE